MEEPNPIDRICGIEGLLAQLDCTVNIFGVPCLLEALLETAS
jgi:hypothetical protein